MYQIISLLSLTKSIKGDYCGCAITTKILCACLVVFIQFQSINLCIFHFLLGVTFVYLSKRTSHRLIRHVCRASIGLFQSIKRTSNVLWQGIKAVTNAVMSTRQDSTCTDIHQQTDALTLHSIIIHTSSTCSYNTASTSIGSLSSEDLTASSPTCASPYLNDVLLSDGCGSSPSCGSPIARSSSSHSVEYSRGQFILGGSFNLEVLEKLGEGGFGTVYKVLGRDTIYAAKLSTYLNSEYVHEEFETLLDLSHPNIVHVLEKLPKGYLMEFCSNDLSNLIKTSGPIKGETCCDISLGIARAVSYIHLQYLAHLDIKPENILLTESGSPKLADFGSATYFKKLDGTCRLLDQSTGTFGYAPPEMLDFKPPIHMARMDSWCLGATFFQMLTGKRAFVGETKEELLANQLSSNFDLPKGRCHRDQFSCDYMALIRKLCTVNPKSRISPGEAKRRLKEYKLFMLLNTWDRDEYHC